MTELIYHISDIHLTYYLLIPRFELMQTRLLVLETPEGYTLPHVHPREHHFGIVEHINQYVRDRYDLGVSVMMCLSDELSFAENVGWRYYALDSLDDDWQAPADARWVTAHEARELSYSQPHHAEQIGRYFGWLGHDDERRVPWAKHGWFRRIAPRIADIADRLGYTPLDIEQVRAWGRSSTLRLVTDRGDLYVKALPTMFAYEPVVTRILHLRYPANTPKVLAVDVDEAWMLMEAFKGDKLSTRADIAIWERVVIQYARIQQDIIASTGSLIALGIPDRNVDQIAAQIDRLMIDLPPQLSDDEKDTLRRVARTLRTLCHDLMEMKVPLSLVHGDLWAGNIVVDEAGEALFFDWSDCAVSHPFFDLPFFLSDLERELPGVEDAYGRLRDAYLDQWTRYDSLERLRQVFELARVLSPLHMAMMYQRSVLPGMEESSQWEMENMLPHLLRQVIASLKAYSPL